MKDNYDFTNGIKNPFADRIRSGYSVNPFTIIEDDPIPLSKHPHEPSRQEAVGKHAKTK